MRKNWTLLLVNSCNNCVRVSDVSHSKVTAIMLKTWLSSPAVLVSCVLYIMAQAEKDTVSVMICLQTPAIRCDYNKVYSYSMHRSTKTLYWSWNISTNVHINYCLLLVVTAKVTSLFCWKSVCFAFTLCWLIQSKVLYCHRICLFCLFCLNCPHRSVKLRGSLLWGEIGRRCTYFCRWKAWEMKGYTLKNVICYFVCVRHA